jgi:hypothetical protein
MEDIITNSTNSPNTENITNKDEAVLRPQKEKKEMTCMSITCWVLQIAIWVEAIYLSCIDVYEESLFTKTKYLSSNFIMAVVFEGALYITYVIFQFFTPTFHYLIHKRSDINFIKK